jgi:threonine synthase
MLLREGVIRPDETVVCVLTGHQLKDPDATVTYHTGIDTKAAQGEIGAQHRHEPRGGLANRPIRVADDLGAIMAAMGLR